MKKILLIPLALMLLTVISSCFDNDDSVPSYIFTDEPAIYTHIGGREAIKTAYGLFVLPDTNFYHNASAKIAAEGLSDGALLWTEFVVTVSEENYIPLTADTACYMALNFRCERVDSSSVVIPASSADALNDGYDEAIELASLYRSSVETFLFFGFTYDHEAVGHRYRLVLLPDEKGEGGFPTLCIRSQQTETVASAPHPNMRETVYAFDMSAYIRYFRESVSATGPIRFNLKYKTGVNADGTDEYHNFLSNPLTWDVK
jgi:hypothetical protein